MSYSSITLNNVYDITWPEVRRRSMEVAPCCSHTVVQFYSIYLKSQAQKLTEKMRFS